MGTDGAGPGVPWKAYAPDLLCSCMSFLNSFWRQAPVRMELVKGEESLFLGLRKESRDNRKKKGEWVTSPVPDHSLFPEWKFRQGSKWLYLGSQETEKLPHVKTRDLVLRARDVGGDWIFNSIHLLGVFLGFLFQPQYTSRNGSVTLSPVLIRENSSTAVHILPSS